jgi:urocanate hydratase
LVNSLDEALRILKNEIRKRETVAVCIASPPQAVEREMLERGVLPDLLAPPFQPNSPASPTFGHAVPRPKILPALGSQVLVTWRVATAPAQWLPKLDAIAFDCLPTTPDHETRVARRWLRVAPRYLGRLAQSVRVLHCDLNIAKQIVERIQSAVDRGEFATEVHIALTR